MIEIKLDKYTNVQELAGKNFLHTPFKLRAMLHETLSESELLAFRQNNCTPELLKKCQDNYNQWHADAFPSEQELLNRQREARKESDMENLNRTLKRNKEQLAKLDKMVENDMPVKAGERVRLRQEILQLETQLSVHNSITTTTSEPSDSTEQDWVDSVLL